MAGIDNLRARLLSIRLAAQYDPKFKPNPKTAKPSDFGVIKKKKGTEANPVNQNLRPAPKTPHSNKFMNKRLFAKDKKKEQLDHHVKNKEGWDEIKRESYEEPQPAYPEEIEAAEERRKSVYGKKKKKKKTAEELEEERYNKAGNFVSDTYVGDKGNMYAPKDQI